MEKNTQIFSSEQKYIVHIEESFLRTLEVRAKDSDEAMDIAITMYKAGNAPASQLATKQISISDPEPTEWVEFM